ncbi:MAG: RNA 2'-phosphotransferase [Bacteroidetes bacterium]|nr:RNA 2'-phosphotransferase [Bacteroidota bacterium]
MQDPVKSSKFLSLVLRHQPDKIGLVLDQNGWVGTSDLLEKLNYHGFKIDLEQLKIIVQNNNKQRFAFSDDFQKIRANQGHSVSIDLALEPKCPPEILFHGTAHQNLESIKKHGLVKAKRQHVHLSSDEKTAIQVGGRHGKPIVLFVKSGEMHQAGHTFFQSENGVWLINSVPIQFLIFPS